jgi:hypothetical protein
VGRFTGFLGVRVRVAKPTDTFPLTVLFLLLTVGTRHEDTILRLGLLIEAWSEINNRRPYL